VKNVSVRQGVRVPEPSLGSLLAGIEVVERDLDAEDPAFVRECVDRLIQLIEATPG
jgi:hypothetical protein